MQCSPLSYPATGCSTHILNIPLIRRISGREFLSPYNRTLYCSLYMFVANRTHQIAYFDHPMKVDQSDFFYDHVCSILGDTGSQACLVNKRYVSVWLCSPPLLSPLVFCGHFRAGRKKMSRGKRCATYFLFTHFTRWCMIEVARNEPLNRATSCHIG